jgi:hypothetical protein
LDNIDKTDVLITVMPGLLMLCHMAGFILLKIPAMTASLFSGHIGWHSSGMGGLITGLLLKGMQADWRMTMATTT